MVQRKSRCCTLDQVEDEAINTASTIPTMINEVITLTADASTGLINLTAGITWKIYFR
jgi:hypothetical protein